MEQLRLQNIIRKYDKLYIDDIGFNENSYEIEVELFIGRYKNRNDFIKDCIKIKNELEKNGYKCAYDDDFSDTIFMLYIII